MAEDVSLMGLVRIAYGRRRIVIALAIGLPVLTAVIVLFMPNRYTAEGAILLEVSESIPDTEFLGQLSGLVGLPKLSASADTYLAILNSRRVGEAVVDSLDLAEHYGIEADTPEQVRELALLKLRRFVHVDNPNAPLLRIRATDPDPEMAAAIVNAFLTRLEDANQTLALSRARRTRILVEEALVQTETDLELARRSLTDFQARYGVFSLDDQSRGTLNLIAELQGRLLDAQTRRDALAGLYRENSPELRSTEHMITALEAQIAALVGELDPGAGVRGGATGEGRVDPATGNDATRGDGPATGDEPTTGDDDAAGGQAGLGKAGFLLPLSDVPELSGEYARLTMNLKVLESKYSVLATRLEQSKIEESQSVPAFEILDRATRTFCKSGPNRKLYVLTAFLGGLLAGLLLAVFVEDLSRRVDESTRAELLGMLPGVLARRIGPRADPGEAGGRRVGT